MVSFTSEYNGEQSFYSAIETHSQDIKCRIRLQKASNRKLLK